MKLPVSQK